MADDFNHQLNHKLTLRVASISLIAILFAIIFRPLIVSLPSYFTWIAILDFLLVLSVYFIIRSNRLPQWEVAILLSSGIITITPLLLISGGVNSQFTHILPLYPIIAALLGGKWESLCVGIILVFGIIVFSFFGHQVADLTGDIYIEEKSYTRGFWLTITLITSTLFGRFFLKRYNKLTEQLKEENIHDPLTHLFNRRGFNFHFNRNLNQSLLTNSPLSLVLIDIDFFKKVNDKYGHDVGDVCLIEVADTLASNIRKSDILARFGGEEFILVLPETKLNEAANIAEKLRSVIFQRTYSDFNLPLTITLGVANYSEQNTSQLKIIKTADKALYRGKEKGRNRVELA
ncbi:GGDEF domain-containing protein [Marinomonas transparens]|uniref:diguanylate cyclase n=1 Tax=Marinomonas transparens TaxID=2795388 RepID=A0A934JR85_9GAMM|nr:GGDEF domain-containing protein [Marinomonas transparens]MBJ7538353.1 GGDEF domain-containing protein [Marinomonas transparens]